MTRADKEQALSAVQYVLIITLPLFSGDVPNENKLLTAVCPLRER